MHFGEITYGIEVPPPCRQEQEIVIKLDAYKSIQFFHVNAATSNRSRNSNGQHLLAILSSIKRHFQVTISAICSNS